MDISLKIIFSTLLLTLASLLYSQNKSYIPGTPFMDHFSQSEYNGDAQNWAIIQDDRGIMYIGNNTNIKEFDGNKWRTISFNNGRIRGFARDSLGIIYVCGSQNFGYLACDSLGTTQFVSLIDKLPENKRDFRIMWRVKSTKDGIYFISQKHVFHYSNDTIIAIPGEIAYPFAFVIHGKLFVIIMNEGIGWVKENEIHILPHSKVLDRFYSVRIFPFKKNKLLFKPRFSNFHIYHLDKLNLKDLQSFKESSKNVPENIVERFPTEVGHIINNETSLWAGACFNDNLYALGYKYGIVIMNDKGDFIQKIDYSNGLKNELMGSLYIDKNQDLWAALGKGIAKIEVNNPITSFNESTGFETHFLAIEKHKENVYVGGISAIYRLSDNNKQSLFPTLNEITSHFTFDLKSFKNWLFAMTTQGTIVINDDNSSSLLFASRAQFSGGTSPKFPNHFFIGSSEGLFAIHITGNKNPIIEDTIHFDQLNYRIRDIQADKDSNLWISSEHSGVFHLKFKGPDILNYEIEHYDTLKGFPSLFNIYAYPIEENIYACINSIGLYKLEEGVFKPDIEMGRDINKSIGSIMKLNDTYWISENSNLKAKHKINTGFKTDSLPYSKISFLEEIFAENDSTIWAGGSSGLYRVNIKKEKDYQIPFNTLIRKIFINRDSLLFNGTYFDHSAPKNGLFPISSLEQPEILIPNLSYKNKDITFNYSATYYDKQYPNEFSYKLEGYDKNWSEWSSETIKEYTNLNEGEYEFKIKSKNLYETEGNIATYKFTISPPIYRTIWAYITYVVLGILIIQLIVFLNSRRLKALNVRLEKIIRNRTAEIQEKNEELIAQKEEIEAQKNNLEKTNKFLAEANATKEKFFSIIAHDLKSPFNALLGFSEILAENYERINRDKIGTYGKQMFASAKQLFNLVENLLSWSRTKTGRVNNFPESIDLFIISKDIQNLLRLNLEQKRIRLNIIIHPKTNIYADKNLIETIVRNLVSNAIKFTDEDGTITLHSKKADNFIQVSVTDNGMGMSQDEIDKLFREDVHFTKRGTQKEKGSGLGLILCKEFVEKSGGKIWVESKPEKGSSFIFTVPVEKKD